PHPRFLTPATRQFLDHKSGYMTICATRSNHCGHLPSHFGGVSVRNDSGRARKRRSVELWDRGSAGALVAEIDEARAERLGFHQTQIQGFGERREVGGAVAEDDRVDELAVLVDQVRGDGGRG